MPRIIHFEIHAEDPSRAMRFYSSLFGWEFTKWGGPEDYYLIKTGPDAQPGINGGMIRRRGAAPADGQAVNAFVCTMDVTSVDELVAKLAGAGGTLALPKMAIPGVGWLAYGKDTEGNLFGMMQNDASAR